MKHETIAKIGMAIVFIALAIQLVFLGANAIGKDRVITREAKAFIGITW